MTNTGRWTLNLYWSQLEGPKQVLYVPNNGHGLNDYLRLTSTLIAFHRQAAAGRSLPQLDGQLQIESGQLQARLTCDQPLKEATCWIAISESRDFRKSKWVSIPCTRTDEAFTLTHELPAGAYLAGFVEGICTIEGAPCYLSSTMRVFSLLE